MSKRSEELMDKISFASEAIFNGRKWLSDGAICEVRYGLREAKHVEMSDGEFNMIASDFLKLEENWKKKFGKLPV